MTTPPPSKRLAAWRLQAGLSLKEAGQLFGVAAPNVLAYETGEKRPGKGARRELVEAHTGIPADDWATPEELELSARAARAQARADTERPTPTPPTPRTGRKPARARSPGPQKARAATTPKRRPAPKAQERKAA